MDRMVAGANDSHRRIDLIRMQLAVFPKVRVFEREREVFEVDATRGGEGCFQRERRRGLIGGRWCFRLAPAVVRRHEERVDDVRDQERGDDRGNTEEDGHGLLRKVATLLRRPLTHGISAIYRKVCLRATPSI